MATHSSILVWETPCTEECGGLQVHRVSKSRTQQKRLSKHTCSRRAPGALSKCRFLILTTNQPTWNLWSMGPGQLANSPSYTTWLWSILRCVDTRDYWDVGVWKFDCPTKLINLYMEHRSCSNFVVIFPTICCFFFLTGSHMKNVAHTHMLLHNFSNPFIPIQYFSPRKDTL